LRGITKPNISKREIKMKLFKTIKRKILKLWYPEKWKPIKNYEGLYEISNYGRVRSLDRTIKHPTGKDNKRYGHIMKLKINKSGYYHIGLRKEGKRKWFTVHRLLALAFIENSKAKNQINHIDGIKTNNNIKNLEWVTIQENHDHAWNTGLIKGKLTEEQVLEIRRIYKKYSKEFGMPALAKKYKVDDSCICRIVNRKAYKNI